MEDKTTKVRIAFFIILVGIATMFTAVVTDHWAVLSPRVERLNTTCQAAHFGLWRLCLKSIYIQEPDPKGKGCGPISLPGACMAREELGTRMAGMQGQDFTCQQNSTARTGLGST
ncbi:Voltage-dependent calcium channel gamma-1 subunit [Acipenser ruthenus]|uniref:Voltage-dependent calcium channel gamma-1 subunit n=1 Tax=Acipenser ruthenus TaxID=7906 RepID=A0A662YYC8_ACIRT|nr:Voltage-dependent calcium channel gamma-1 subunit [Acipenser ruthenus]